MQNLIPTNKGEVVIYRPDTSIHLEVLTDQETVWLTQAQLSMLFQRDQSVISRHLNNIFKEGELDEKSNMQILHITNIDRPTSFYNLDVIISVGYRVKSHQGVLFRQWATRVLKDYILKGYVINQRIERLEYQVFEHGKQIETLVQQALPPVEGIFYDGQIFDAYAFVSDLIKSAKILTSNLNQVLKQDLSIHNIQYAPIKIEKFTKSHDRFLFIDNDVYHIGASLKDLGKKWFAFSKMKLSPLQWLPS